MDPNCIGAELLGFALAPKRDEAVSVLEAAPKRDEAVSVLGVAPKRDGAALVLLGVLPKSEAPADGKAGLGASGAAGVVVASSFFATGAPKLMGAAGAVLGAAEKSEEAGVAAVPDGAVGANLIGVLVLHVLFAGADVGRGVPLASLAGLADLVLEAVGSSARSISCCDARMGWPSLPYATRSKRLGVLVPSPASDDALDAPFVFLSRPPN